MTKKFLQKSKHFFPIATLFHFIYALRRLSPFWGWAIERFHRQKGRSNTLWPYQKGFLPIIFLNKTLELYIPCNALLLMKWIIFLMKMKLFSFS